MASRHALLIGGVWLAAVVAATSVGVVAVRLVSNQVGDQVSDPLTTAGIQQALGSAAPTPPAEPVQHRTPPATDEGVARTVSTAGGIVSARCSDGTATLLYATPADGYRTVRDASAVRFVGRARQVTLTLACRDDQLQVATRTDRIGTGSSPRTTPAPSPAPTRQTSPAAPPSEHPEPSESPHEDSSGGFQTSDG